MNHKLLRLVVSLMLVPMVLACTCTSLNPGALLGGKGTPTVKPPAGGTPPVGRPTATKPAASGGGVPGNIPAGQFVYEVTDLGSDNKKIDGGVFQDATTSLQYVFGFAEKGALARYSVTLFIPLDVKPGKITLKLYPKTGTQAPSAAIIIGAWTYYATGGTLTVDSIANNKITGSFEFKAAHQQDASKVATVKGTFNQIPLVKK